MEFVIGGLAGAGATIVTNPMDVIKTRLQLQGELKAKSEAKARYKGIFHALYVIGKMDGAAALQSGLAPAMLLGFTMNSVRLGLYHISEAQGFTKDAKGQLSVPKALACACFSGAVSGLVSNPVSVVKTRIQAAAHPSIAVGRQHRYNGTWHAFATIYKTEGMRGYLAGINATCSRLAIGSAAQLTTFSASKETLINHGIFIERPLALAFAASALSGIAVASAMCPLDVVAIRLYNQGPPSAKGELLYNGVIDCLRKIYTTEGFHGLYKGFGPLYLRIAPHTTLSLVIWDMLNSILLKESYFVVLFWGFFMG